MSKRNILIVDDHADVERAKLRGWEESARVDFRHPEDVTIEDLKTAHVVVVDFRLDDVWSGRDEASCIALKPMNGLALLQVLKSHEWTLSGSPSAFVLRSAHLSDLIPGLQPDTRLHSIARQHGLEWVLEKTTDPTRLAVQLHQICSLADAVAALPERWPSDSLDSVSQLFRQWLNLTEVPWESLAWQDIEDCHPPIHELETQRDGMRIVRWLAQRILPYPCFLVNEAQLANRLKVTLSSLTFGLKNGLREFFSRAEYTGALSGFSGYQYWWRSGLESILWEASEGRSFETDYIVGILNNACGGCLNRLAINQSVLCLNEKLGWDSAPIDISDAVRIQPDDWPVFADQAWTSLREARKYPKLAAAVIAADRSRLSLTPEENV